MVRNADHLIEAVKYGRLTPREAEAEAERLGLPPLAPQPDKADFDAMVEPWWSLPMVVAWITWRSPAEVRDAWDTYRRQCTYWVPKQWRFGPDGPVYKGFFLEPLPLATFSLLDLKEIHQRSQGTTPKDATSIKTTKEMLWKALQDNAMQATGLSTETKARGLIPDYEWRDLADIEEDGRDVVRMREGRGYSKRGYDDVALRSKDVLAIWQSIRLEEARLPPTMSPDGHGYMPLYCAAQWIATRGGTFDFDPKYQAVWKNAYADLLGRISSNDVAVTGIRERERAKLDGHIFAGIRVRYPFDITPFDLIFSEELYLSTYMFADDEHWHGGFDDSLDNRDGRQITKLLVLKSDVARWWPFGLSQQPDISDPYRTGTPGRPSSKHLIEAEHAARWDRGEANKGIGDEAKALLAWLKLKHRKAPQPGLKAIENNIRDEHRRRLADLENKKSR